MLSIENISLQYENLILNEVSFTVDENEIIGIAGISGTGKTSLLKIIAGLKDASGNG